MKWKVFGIIAVIVLCILTSVYLIRRRKVSEMENTKLSENFTLDEFVTTLTGYDNVPDATQIENIRRLVVNVLQPLRTAVGKPVKINSGFRSELVNRAVGGESNSQHLANGGEAAADIKVEGMTNEQIILAIRALNLPYDQVIDERKNSDWVHVSHRASGNRGNWLVMRNGSYTTISTNFS